MVFQALDTSPSHNRFRKAYSASYSGLACMTDLIVNAGVKEALEDHNVSADLYDALDEQVAEILEEAAARAEANDRKTVMPEDL